MRWPFMLRSVHEARVAEAREQTAADWKAVADYWMNVAKDARTTHDTFVATLADRTLPQAKVVAVPKPVRERDAADVAAETAAAFDPRRRRYLEQFVRERRAAGIDAADIAQAILHPPATGYGEWEAPE